MPPQERPPQWTNVIKVANAQYRHGDGNKQHVGPCNCIDRPILYDRRQPSHARKTKSAATRQIQKMAGFIHVERLRLSLSSRSRDDQRLPTKPSDHYRVSRSRRSIQYLPTLSPGVFQDVVSIPKNWTPPRSWESAYGISARRGPMACMYLL